VKQKPIVDPQKEVWDLVELVAKIPVGPLGYTSQPMFRIVAKARKLLEKRDEMANRVSA